MADAEGEAEEAISHALVAEGQKTSDDFRSLRDNIRELRKKMQNETIMPKEGIIEVRKIRGQFESSNPSYDVSRCQACGSVEGFLEDFKRTDEKGLYPSNAEQYYSDNKMKADTKDLALVIGGVNIGWGVGYSAKAYIDPMAPGAIMGQDPSLLVDIGGTAIAAIAALKLRGSMAKKLSAYIAAGLSTHIWDDLAKLLAPAAAAAAPRARAVGAPMLGARPVGEMMPGIPGMPVPAARLAGYPFPSPVSVGQTMSPPHYTLNGVPGLSTVSLAPKYVLDTI